MLPDFKPSYDKILYPLKVWTSDRERLFGSEDLSLSLFL